MILIFCFNLKDKDKIYPFIKEKGFLYTLYIVFKQRIAYKTPGNHFT